ncbi:hypothetical protein ACUSIJ_07100 [Pseudochelatococcus sp. B33]
MSLISNVRTVLAGALLLMGAQIVTGPSAPEREASGPGPAHAGVLAWLVPAAQAAEPLRLADIRIGNDAVSVEIPQASVEGSNLTQPELQSLFDDSAQTTPAGRSVAERLAAFSAALVTIPELTVTVMGGGTTQITRYFDVELRDIASGVIGRATAGRASSSVTAERKDENGDTNEEERFSGTIGRIAVEAVDTVFTARLLTGDASGSASGERPTQPLHGPFTISDYRFTQHASDENDELTVEVTIDTIAGEGVSARQPRTPLSQLFGMLDATGDDLDDLPPEKLRILLIGFADLLSSFDFGKTTASDVNIRSEGTADGVDFTVRIQSIASHYGDQQLGLVFNDIAASSQPKAKADGKTEPDTVSIGRFAVENLSFGSTITALEEAARSDLTGKDGNSALLDGARFAPTGGRLMVADVDVDVDISDEESKQADRFAFSIRTFETTTGGNVAGGRSHFETVLTDLHARLPDTDADGLRELRALGYEELTISSVFRGNWDEATNQLAIDTLSLSGVDIGSIAAGARFGNVGRDAYSGDISLILQALEQSSLHDLTLTLEDGGLFERFVKQQSAAGAGSEDELRQQYAALASIGIPALIGETPAARKIANAVSRFATAPGKLTLTAKARDPQGVPLSTLDLDAAPAKLMEHFDITTSN